MVVCRHALLTRRRHRQMTLVSSYFIWYSDSTVILWELHMEPVTLNEIGAMVRKDFLTHWSPLSTEKSTRRSHFTDSTGIQQELNVDPMMLVRLKPCFILPFLTHFSGGPSSHSHPGGFAILFLWPTGIFCVTYRS